MNFGLPAIAQSNRIAPTGLTTRRKNIASSVLYIFREEAI
jgi:hypothetical protein